MRNKDRIPEFTKELEKYEKKSPYYYKGNK